MDFSKIVKEILKQRDMTVTELANKMGYCVQYVSDLLSGRRRWNETTMKKACEVLGIKVNYSISDKIV